MLINDALVLVALGGGIGAGTTVLCLSILDHLKIHSDPFEDLPANIDRVQLRASITPMTVTCGGCGLIMSETDAHACVGEKCSNYKKALAKTDLKV